MRMVGFNDVTKATPCESELPGSRFITGLLPQYFYEKTSNIQRYCGRHPLPLGTLATRDRPGLRVNRRWWPARPARFRCLHPPDSLSSADRVFAPPVLAYPEAQSGV